MVAINRTAIEAEWDLPPIDFRGGFILGYKLFIQSTNGGAERTIDITDNSTVYVVEGLQPATEYRLSVLAYTSVGDGPRSIHLTLSTLSKDHGSFVYTILCILVLTIYIFFTRI